MITQKKIAWSLAGNLVDVAIGFGTVMLITRLYDEKVAGQWFVFVAIFSLLTNLREGFVQNGLVKYSVGNSEAERLKVYKTNLVSNLLFELVMSTLVVGLFTLFNWYDLKELFWYYPLYSVPFSIYRWIFVVHRSQLRVEKSTLMNALFLGVLSIGAGLMYTRQLPLPTMVFTLGAASTVAAVAGLFSFDVRAVWQVPFDRAMFRLLFHYGKHGILRELTGTVSTRINIFLTAGMLSYTQTAYLGVAQRYVMLLLIPNNAFQAILYPVLVKIALQKDEKLLKEEFEKQVSKLLSMTTLVAIAIIITSPFIIDTLHGANYRPALGLLIISLITVALFTPFGSAFGSVVNALEKPTINSRIVIVNSAINITLSYVLICYVGLYGAVMAPFITELFGFLWTSRIIKTQAGIHYGDCFRSIPHHYGQWIKKLKLAIIS